MFDQVFISCPVCGYPNLVEMPYDESGSASFDICPSCGTEFGYHDSVVTHVQLRKLWVDTGSNWFSEYTRPPDDWNAQTQLKNAGFIA
jgi:transcription elongation factor Elf1